MAFALARQDAAAAPDSARGRSRDPVRIWLYALAALVVAMVAVGGATRLTGSGLSITEWRPVTGAIPPLSEGAWLEEFAKYRDSPQYRLLNQGMSLAEFKFIYAWEWAHRQLGRLIGLAFFGPFLWFWLKGLLRRRLALALVGIGALGALQGAVGWIMVASGLEPGMIAVAPVKLALHLLIASAILASLVWVAAGLTSTSAGEVGRAVRLSAFILLALVFLQIGLGGLVAGSKAGLTYNTWPLMDGRFAPPLRELFAATPLVENFVDNVALVQLDHRVVAYLVVAFALFHAAMARRAARQPLPAGGSPPSPLDRGAARRAAALAALALAQMGLGIATLVLVVPLWAGLAHQVVAMLLLGMATAQARLCALRGTSANLEKIA
jgi:cytochrome c oxidase assembly protein subunit 15